MSSVQQALATPGQQQAQQAAAPPADPAQAILAPLQGVDDNVKADAWEAFNKSDGADFEKNIGALPIPNEAKAALWEAKNKMRQQAASPAPPQQVSPPTPPGPVSRLIHSAASAVGVMPGSNEEVKNRLAEIAKHPINATTQFAKGVLDAQGELAYKAKDAWEKGDHTGAAAYALYYLMPLIGPTLAKSSEQLSSGDIAGGIGTSLGAAAPIIAGKVGVPSLGATEAAAPEAAGEATPLSVKEAAASGPERVTAGQVAQESAARIRQEQGAAVGAAKEAARPETFGMDVGPESGMSNRLADIEDKIGSEEKGLSSLKDDEMNNVRSVMKELDPEKVKTFDNGQIDAIRDQLNAKIKQQQTAVANGHSTGTALGYYKQLKSAFDDELHDQISTKVGAQESENLRAANKQYAQTVERQTRGPVSDVFKAKTPEDVIKKINSSRMDGTRVKELLTDRNPEEVQTIRQGAMKDLVNSKTTNGKVKWSDVLDKLDRQKESSKALYGPDYDAIRTQIVSNAKWQARKAAAVEVVKSGAKIAAGAGVAGAAYKGYEILKGDE